LARYAIKIKSTKIHSSTGELTKSGFLTKQYGQRDIYWTVPYNRGLKRKDHNIGIVSDSTLEI
jgi:phage-related protein